jgi:hypothetical protein
MHVTLGFDWRADMASAQTGPVSPPLTESVIAALARLMDDSQSSRQPAHSEIEDQFRRAGLMHADPNQTPPPKGKAKRIRGVLQWAIDNDVEKGQKLVSLLVALVRGVGGFNEGSNFVGAEAIRDLRNAFASEGFNLTEPVKSFRQSSIRLPARN